MAHSEAFYQRNDPDQNLQLLIAEAEAQMKMHQGDHEESERLWTTLMADYPHHVEPSVGRGELYLKMGRYADALADFQKADTIEPNYPKIHYKIGAAYEGLNMFEPAVKAYYQAIKLIRAKEKVFWDKALLTETYAQMATCLLTVGHYSETLWHLTEAIEMAPNHARFYHQLALASYHLGAYESAMDWNSKAIELAPNFSIAYHNRALCYEAMGLTEQAEADYQKAASLGHGK